MGRGVVPNSVNQGNFLHEELSLSPGEGLPVVSQKQAIFGSSRSEM